MRKGKRISEYRLSRRRMLHVMAGVAAGATLSACAPSAPAAGPTQPPAPAATKPPAPAATQPPAPTAAPTIDSVIPKAASGGFTGEVVEGISAGPEADAHVRLAARFKEATGGTLTVRVDGVGRDVWMSRYTANFQSRSDAWDAVSVTTAMFKMAGPAGWLIPVEDFMGDSELFNAEKFDVEDWPKAIRDLFTIDGKLYEFPQEASAFMFFYRKDLVDKWGLEHPGENGFTWDQLIDNAREAMKAIKAEGLEGTVYPLIFPVGKEQASVCWMQTAWSYGGAVYKDNYMVPCYDTPENIQALADIASWYKEGLMSPGCTGYGYAEVQTAIQQGGGVYALEWNAAAPDLMNPDKSPITAGNMAFSIWPYHKDQSPEVLRHWPSVWAQGVSAFSKKPEEAFSYCAFFTSKESARDYVMNGGGSSGRQSLLTDPEVLAKNPQYGPMLKGLASLHPGGNMASSDYLRKTVLPPYLMGAISGEYTPEEALKKANEEATNYLKDKGEI